MNAKRLVVYVVLNVVVSATATLTVLWLWDRSHPPVAAPASLSASATLAAAATSAPAVTVPSPTPFVAPTATPTLYIVQPGDTLLSIAQRYELSIDVIMTANGLDNPNVLSSGQTLLIPLAADPGLGAQDPPIAATELIEPPRPTATRDPSVPLPRLDVREVRSAGVVAQEVLVIVNAGGPVDLAGWSLRDESGHLYVFPSLMLFEDGAINLHTAAGTDTVTDLYWGQSQAVWASGKPVLLSDAGGNLHARFTVP